MKLNIHPIVGLVDQKLDVCVTDLPPFAKIRLSASFSLPWAKSVYFESEAWFTADANGQVDLSRQKPDAGSYDFVDPMGPIVSAMSQDPKALDKIATGISVEESLFIEITAECGKERESVRLARQFKSSQVKSLRITDEFVGELFYTENANYPSVVWIGGSGSGLAVNAPVAAALASHGFNVLSLPFFGDPGLPVHLSAIPLEYFDRALAWLAKNPITQGKDVYILGMSRGAEAGLILVSRHPEIQKAALWAPHAYSFQGIAFKNESTWTEHGKQVPYIRMKNRWVLADMIRCMIKNEPFGFTRTYRKSLALAQNKAAARIPVENAQADLLLVTSTDCNMWNTYDGSQEIMETLRKCHYPHAYDLVIYEDAGEPYYVPYVIPAGITSKQIAPRLVLSMGGTLQGNAHAKEDSWVKTIEFFNQDGARSSRG